MIGAHLLTPRLLAEFAGVVLIAALSVSYKVQSTRFEALRSECKATALEAAKSSIEYSAEYGRIAAELREAQLLRDLAAERAALRDSARSDEADRQRMEKLENAQEQDPGDWGSAPVPDAVRDRLRQFQADFADRTG